MLLIHRKRYMKVSKRHAGVPVFALYASQILQLATHIPPLFGLVFHPACTRLLVPFRGRRLLVGQGDSCEIINSGTPLCTHLRCACFAFCMARECGRIPSLWLPPWPGPLWMRLRLRPPRSRLARVLVRVVIFCFLVVVLGLVLVEVSCYFLVFVQVRLMFLLLFLLL